MCFFERVEEEGNRDENDEETRRLRVENEFS
jgi:hypothetical protein